MTSADSPSSGSASVPHPRTPWFFVLFGGLIAVYLSITLYHIGDLPLIDPDEPRYAAASRTIAREASLSNPESILIPQFNGKPRVNKPPLFYWIVAASDRLAGEATERSARMPSLVMGLLMLIITVLLGRRVYGDRVAFIGGLILLSMPLFLALSKCCITDMTLSTFMVAALTLLMLGMLELSSPRKAAWLASVCLGLALLTKATPALAVVMVVVFDRALILPAERRPALTRYILVLLASAAVCSGLSMFFEYCKMDALDNIFNAAALLQVAMILLAIAAMAWRAPRGALAAMPWLAALIVAFVIGLWWYGALIVLKGWEQFQVLLREEIGSRITGGVHRQHLLYYIPMLYAVAAPWGLGMIGTVGSAWQAGGDDSAPLQRRGDRFLLAWLLGILVFFSIPGAKLATYILSAMPAFALLTARFLTRLANDTPPVPRIWKHATLLVVVLSLIGLTAVAFGLKFFPRDFTSFAADLPHSYQTMVLQITAAIVGAWILALLKRPIAASLILAASLLITLQVVFDTCASHFVEPRSTRKLCRQVKEKIADCQRVASVGAEVESLSYYMDRTIEESRRRRVVQRRSGSTAPLDPSLPPVTEDEPFDAVVREELARTEKVALFVQRRYYARMLGIKNADIAAMKADEIARSVPPYAKFVGVDDDIVVIRN